MMLDRQLSVPACAVALTIGEAILRCGYGMLECARSLDCGLGEISGRLVDVCFKCTWVGRVRVACTMCRLHVDCCEHVVR